ncbi:hypothetical protein [Streptomyces rimosus]|uniref:hypothetical protein n=1 Tax=Streptomyces rimosus TaxID=1927 RepID=UPI0004C2380C|nr:hypothetical protein [Streptomyces rimosus]
MSAYIREIISGLNKNARNAIIATANAEDGRVPYSVHDRTKDALHRRRLIREVTNRRGGFNWCVLTWTGKRVAAALAERATAPTATPKTAPAFKLSPAEAELQYANAARLFAALHPAAAEIVNGYQENAIQTVVEGGPHFTCGEVWGQIGAEPGQRLAWNADDDPEEWATADGFNTVWAHINRLATAGKLDLARWDALVTEARDVLATASVRPAPVVLDKRPSSWQVLWHTESPLTGEQWADLPVHSVVRTSQLRAGQDWATTDQQLTARGLSRYDFPAAVSAGHALALAQERWREDGPHSAWFAFLDGASEEIESLRAKYNPTPEQERQAFAWAMATLANPAPELTFAEVQAIASGQTSIDQG